MRMMSTLAYVVVAIWDPPALVNGIGDFEPGNSMVGSIVRFFFFLGGGKTG